MEELIDDYIMIYGVEFFSRGYKEGKAVEKDGMTKLIKQTGEEEILGGVVRIMMKNLFPVYNLEIDKETFYKEVGLKCYVNGFKTGINYIKENE